jgi:hypothetical protein
VDASTCLCFYVRAATASPARLVFDAVILLVAPVVPRGDPGAPKCRCGLARQLHDVIQGEPMKKLMAMLFAAVFATVSIGVTVLPSVSYAAEKKKAAKKDSKKSPNKTKKKDNGK